MANKYAVLMSRLVEFGYVDNPALNRLLDNVHACLESVESDEVGFVKTIQSMQSEVAELRKERDEVINYLKLIECEPINSEYFAGQALDMLGVK